MTNREAIEATLSALVEAKVIDEQSDAAIISAVRSLAEQLDARGRANAQLWKVYIDALKCLAVTDGGDTDRTLSALEKIASASAVCNAPASGAANIRAKGGTDSGVSGDAAHAAPKADS